MMIAAAIIHCENCRGLQKDQRRRVPILKFTLTFQKKSDIYVVISVFADNKAISEPLFV